MAKRATRGRSNAARNKIKFEHRLVLANWMLDLFGVQTFEGLAKNMRDPAFEGFNEDNVSRFHQCLKLLFDRPELPHDLLLAYDENIVRHWKTITEHRNHTQGQKLHPKYFQYLCLLFTAFYLDPPYPSGARVRQDAYRHEAADEHHRELVEAMLALEGQAVLSGYDTSIYGPLEKAGWRRAEKRTVCYAAGKVRGSKLRGKGSMMKEVPRTEVLWIKEKRNKRRLF